MGGLLIQMNVCTFTYNICIVFYYVVTLAHIEGRVLFLLAMLVLLLRSPTNTRYGATTGSMCGRGKFVFSCVSQLLVVFLQPPAQLHGV